MKFGFRISELRGFTTKHTKLFSCIIIAIVLLPSFLSFAFSSEKWPGVDETVVEKYAQEHGRESRDPLINTDQGDLLLFVFLLAGVVGGFIGGYCWKTLMEKRVNSVGIPKKDSKRGV